jgi:hypothetical protein
VAELISLSRYFELQEDDVAAVKQETRGASFLVNLIDVGEIFWAEKCSAG